MLGRMEKEETGNKVAGIPFLYKYEKGGGGGECGGRVRKRQGQNRA